MGDKERPYLVPDVRPAEFGWGHEIEFERWTTFNERSSSLCVGELSLDDLEALYQELGAYLDKARHQE